MINTYKIWMPPVSHGRAYRQQRLIIISCRESRSPLPIAFPNQTRCFSAFPAGKLLARREKWGAGARLQQHILHEILRRRQDEVIVIVTSNYRQTSEGFKRAQWRADSERCPVHVKKNSRRWNSCNQTRFKTSRIYHDDGRWYKTMLPVRFRHFQSRYVPTGWTYGHTLIILHPLDIDLRV